MQQQHAWDSESSRCEGLIADAVVHCAACNTLLHSCHAPMAACSSIFNCQSSFVRQQPYHLLNMIATLLRGQHTVCRLLQTQTVAALLCQL
jgi:hypothetical protein